MYLEHKIYTVRKVTEDFSLFWIFFLTLLLSRLVAFGTVDVLDLK